MQLKFYFFLLATLLGIMWAVLLALTYERMGLWFYLTEALMLLSFVVLILFYRKVVKPMHIIGNGMELLSEQDFSSRLSSVGQAEADRIVQVFNRMMEQLKNERLRLREQNHFLDLLISASPMGVVIMDFDGNITMMNQAALRFLELPHLQAAEKKQLHQLVSPLAEKLSHIQRGKTETIRLSDAMIYRCSHLSFVDCGFAHPFVLIESLTHEVVKAEKKAYEKVIRMIAHEVNNTVAGITSTLDSVADELEAREEATYSQVQSDDLREVMQVCVERCFSMSRFITNFADVVKIPEPQLERVELNERVSACSIFLESICNHPSIHLRLDLCEEPLWVNLDTTLFEQVLINIVKNGAESMENGGIAIEPAVVLEPRTAANTNANASSASSSSAAEEETNTAVETIGERVVGKEAKTVGQIVIRTTANPPLIEIANTGKPITKEEEEKLFTPFYSTKPNGQGIGLIFIREVLIKQGCSFSLRTYEDGVTRFKIRFT